ncbi:hypothetical protein [Fredinandcohnia sp. 179-A 10B2 NHS]|uniref:hypothetical protein n=1 Tax=Fredinandcohnia sp. 179-A 10B2 NHS TaxID=3235176 RepID=UPI0039A00F5D
MLWFKISAVFLILVYVIFLARKEYKNFTNEQKEEFKKELRVNPFYLFLHMLSYIGYFFLFISIVFYDIPILRYIAFFLMGLGYVIDGAEQFELKNAKGGVIIIAIGSIMILGAAFFVLRSYFLVG